MYELLTLSQQTSRLQSRRIAKRKSIYKRLSHIRKIIASNGSRTKVKALVDYIERTFSETELFHDQLMTLISKDSKDHDDMWIESVRMDIDICLSEVREYIEFRSKDPPSDSESNASSLHLTCDDDLIDLEPSNLNTPTSEPCRFIDSDIDRPLFESQPNLHKNHPQFPPTPKTDDQCSVTHGIAPPNDAPHSKASTTEQHQYHSSIIEPPRRLPTNPTISPIDFKSVDSWIDDLCTEECVIAPALGTQDPLSHFIRLASTQNLPEMCLPIFDGSPIDWIDFIALFKDLIHERPYLNGTRKMTYLLQSLTGQAKQAVCGFSHDWTGYVLALKRLKSMFAQRSSIVRAHIDKLLAGDRISNSDQNSLSDFYYSLNNCIVSLLRLDMKSELLASFLLKQVTQRLPSQLQCKWAERSYQIRAFEDPTLFHFESWLKERVMIMKENNIYFPAQKDNPESQMSTVTQSSNSNCELCRNTHRLNKCNLYLSKIPNERLKVVNLHKLCINCLRPGHGITTCPSTLTCKVDDCSERHHTTLHDANEVNYDDESEE